MPAITPAFPAIKVCPACAAQPFTTVMTKGLHGDVQPYLLLYDIPELNLSLRQETDVHIILQQFRILILGGIFNEDETFRKLRHDGKSKFFQTSRAQER